MKLSVVIPAFNEETRIGSSLEAVQNFLSAKGWDYELIVVDDGSSDKTQEVVKVHFHNDSYSKRLICNDGNRGKGYSVRRGMLEAQGECILFTDADLSTPIQEVEKLMEVLSAGYDIAIGSRALVESQVVVHQNLLRELMGKVFNLIARLLTFKGIRDSQCGFKLFRKTVAHHLFSLQKIDGFSFDAEIVYLAQKLGYRIKEVSILWSNSPASKVQIFRDPVRMLRDLIRIRFYHLKDGDSKRS